MVYLWQTKIVVPWEMRGSFLRSFIALVPITIRNLNRFRQQLDRKQQA